MTTEEAIERIQIHLAYMGQYEAPKTKEALDMAISALREQEERSKGCEYCNEILEYNKTHTFPKYVNPFCAVCGRRLEEV